MTTKRESTPATLIRPAEEHVLVSPSLCVGIESVPATDTRAATTNRLVTLASVFTYGVKNTTFFWKRFHPNQHLTLYQSKANNCLIFAWADEKTKSTLTAPINKGTVRGRIHENKVPPPSYSTAILDFYVSKDLFILRWPVLLYANDSISPDDRFRTINRQRRESELIERTYKPLREDRLKPYPFFVPALPLDPLWTPTTLSPLQIIKERNARRRAEQNAGERTV